MPTAPLALDLVELVPIGVTLPVVVLVLIATHTILRRSEKAKGTTFRTQMVMLGLTLAAVVAVVVALPVDQSSKHDILNLLAVLGSAAVALASTTFLSNVLAGLMLRSVRNFRLGDFLRCNDHFGRVTQRGLVHVEIQTEDRDLTTLPNLLLIQHPVTVVRASGTILSTRLSLGYDVPRKDIEQALIAGAEAAGLVDPFVQILELGDFSVTYRVAGLLEDVRQLISTRSRLNSKTLDSLHEAGIEIVSPTFMNTRPLAADAKIVPPTQRGSHADEEEESGKTAEDLAFDKADLAQSLHELEQRLADLRVERAELTLRHKEAGSDEERERIAGTMKAMDGRLVYLERLVTSRKEHLDSGDA